MILPNIGTSSKGDLTPNKLVINLLASCSLINLDFLPSNTARFDKSIGFPIFLCNTWLFTLFFLHFKQYHNSVL